MFYRRVSKKPYVSEAVWKVIEPAKDPLSSQPKPSDQLEASTTQQDSSLAETGNIIGQLHVTLGGGGVMSH